ncbi:MAG: tetratricopeptide repeat protein [Pseudomonadota bacterium]
MFDAVPVQIWLLIAIFAIAFLPARYVLRHLMRDPARRDITQPPPELAWRTTGLLVRNLAVVVALAGFAVFIFTPAAAQWADSPTFLPTLTAISSAAILFTVPRGLSRGNIQPIIRGFYDTYSRSTQPKRFWLSIIWNIAFGSLLGWLSVATYHEAPNQLLVDCYNQELRIEKMLDSCSKLINSDSPNNDVVAGYIGRGTIYTDVGRFDNAVADFTLAHNIAPHDLIPLADRSVAYAWLNDRTRAESDFAAVRAKDPSNPVVVRAEAILKMNSGDRRGAIERLTAALRIDSKDGWSLNKRAENYRALGENEKARKDMQALRVIMSEAAKNESDR